MHNATPNYVCPNCPSGCFFYDAGSRFAEAGGVRCSFCLTKAQHVEDDPIVPYGATRQIEELERLYAR
jgi:hypothetical protein